VPGEFGQGKEVRHLRDSWGNRIEWYDTQLSRPEQYEVMTEMDIAGQTYAILKPVSFTDPHPYLFKYSFGQDGAPTLSSIETEEEWDRAADAVAHWLEGQG
jgi:uncharacterized protein YrzB (UPF0473 family)